MYSLLIQYFVEERSDLVYWENNRDKIVSKCEFNRSLLDDNK